MVEEKSEGLAAVLSFLIPGIGQMYAGRTGRGVGFLLGFIVGIFALIIPGIIIWIWSIVDAMKCAREYNAANTMKCPRCGATLPRGVMMCLLCGAPFSAGAYGSSGYYGQPYAYPMQQAYYPQQQAYYAPQQAAYYAPPQQQAYYPPQPQYDPQYHQQQAYSAQPPRGPQRPPAPPRYP